ncbi:UDP-N-acetylglucosamine 1-carboxyvinyltransferase [Streptomyces sp. SID3343]|uniref:UDP-N-acetylglucosamine 1-carboxyvinyltransferase n=1 Tax=Streptomyces sp. SID3343 TaxID=2690260 RepID=UPI00137046F9|nr:UDP-N-acetylglucosamine 1-carboxyvinyltransferase [Streptomyces sp. SID3343]
MTVSPRSPLTGAVRVDGSKNAALPLLAAAAALGRTVHVHGIPASADVQLMLALIQRSGYRVAQPVVEPGSVLIVPRPGRIAVPVLAEATKIRASYYLVPALLATCGTANLPWPGGCSIGDRGMDMHFRVYEAFGDTIATDEDGYRVTAAGTGPHKVAIGLPFRSRGASVAAILRAVIGRHRLLLANPNLSPEVVGLLTALGDAGWVVRIEDDTVAVEPGSTRVTTVSWEVPGDKIEAGTLACAVAATGGSARVEGVRGADVAPVVDALNLLGIAATAEDHALVVHGDARLTHHPLRVLATLDPGGLDADFEPPLMALALGMPGTHLFADDINPGRHGNLLPQLARLGAEIQEISSTRCRLTGPQRLSGAAVHATDIRTGAALLIAALTARGATTVTGLDQLRRGHADLPAKLRALGADVTEVTR